MEENSIIRREFIAEIPDKGFPDKMFMMLPINKAAFFKIRRALKGISGALFFNLGSHHKIQVAALNVRSIKREAFFPEVNSFAGWHRLKDWTMDYGGTS
ncbi:hypothetical protein CEXT_696221 [Caerostris extrusa]|uniref:Uncharacterized protein n=1 Tax=Caerostris extrusa TaxID=172846 RepID=A0AAV4XFL3_CAEEX|nr:hypothetical protein CEXT_696221 [Caerostris extrusa]